MGCRLLLRRPQERCTRCSRRGNEVDGARQGRNTSGQLCHKTSKSLALTYALFRTTSSHQQQVGRAARRSPVYWMQLLAILKRCSVVFTFRTSKILFPLIWLIVANKLRGCNGADGLTRTTSKVDRGVRKCHPEAQRMSAGFRGKGTGQGAAASNSLRQIGPNSAQ